MADSDGTCTVLRGKWHCPPEDGVGLEDFRYNEITEMLPPKTKNWRGMLSLKSVFKMPLLQNFHQICHEVKANKKCLYLT